jgi:hypothetical protein
MQEGAEVGGGFDPYEGGGSTVEEVMRMVQAKKNRRNRCKGTDSNTQSQSVSKTLDEGVSLDDCVRQLLHPSWIVIRRSRDTHAMLGIVAVIVEVLSAVSIQLATRSYGKCNLQVTLTIWTNLFRQLRVALLLSSRYSTLHKEHLKISYSVQDLVLGDKGICMYNIFIYGYKYMYLHTL